MVKLGTKRRMSPCLANAIAITADKLLEESSCETLEILIYSCHFSFQCTGSLLITRSCRRNGPRKGRIERANQPQKSVTFMRTSTPSEIRRRCTQFVPTTGQTAWSRQRGDWRVDKMGEQTGVRSATALSVAWVRKHRGPATKHMRSYSIEPKYNFYISLAIR